MPLLIACYRKLQALGMLFGEVAAQKVEETSTRHDHRGIIATSVFDIRHSRTRIVLLLLSATILPSWTSFSLWFWWSVCVTALMWRGLCGFTRSSTNVARNIRAATTWWTLRRNHHWLA